MTCVNVFTQWFEWINNWDYMMIAVVKSLCCFKTTIDEGEVCSGQIYVLIESLKSGLASSLNCGVGTLCQLLKQNKTKIQE